MTEDSDVVLPAEQILAAVLQHLDKIEIPVKILLGNYSNKMIAVNQIDDDTLSFELVEVENES